MVPAPFVTMETKQQPPWTELKKEVAPPLAFHHRRKTHKDIHVCRQGKHTKHSHRALSSHGHTQ